MSQRHRPLSWPVAFALVALTCTSNDLTLPSEGLPSAMASVSGSGQSAVVATPLPESLVVRVTDTENRPVEGTKVVFTPLLGGGDAVPDTGLTNQDGVTGARWVLGSTAGAQRMQAMVVGPTSGGALTQTFDATAVAAPADTIFATRGNGQSAEVGAALTDSLVVRVTDRFGNPVSGTSVLWAPTGGGTVSPSTVVTGANGFAATRRTLGASAGPQGATATAAGLKGSPVTFTSTALPASPASLTKASGDNQSAAAGSAVAESLVVVLLDANGNGVPGRNVTFAVATGGGSTSPTSANTDANGRAATRWTLGTAAGSNSLIASSSGFSVTFQATGTAAAAANLLANSPTTQTDTAGMPAASPPSVRVTDANNNPVQGVSVAFAVGSGGGSILPVSAVLTDASGVASLSTWTLGQLVGTNTVTATVPGLTGSPVTFTATGVAGAAARLQVLTEPSASAQSGVAFAVQPAVGLVDVFGNAVAAGGTVVTAALASGSGTLGGTLTASTVAGVATYSNLAITGPTGSYTVRFTSGALVPDTSAAVTIGAGAATRLGMVTQPSTTAQNAVVWASQPSVRVLDAAGTPVAGVRSVTVAIGTGGGTLGGTATINTDAAGLATFSGLSITGTVGARTLAFSSTGLTSVTSNAISITAGAPTQMAVNAGNGQTATAGSAVAVAPSVRVADVSNNPVSGVAVTFAVASGGGSVIPTTAVATNASGVAAATSWTLGTAAGANTLTADAAPAGIAGDPVTFTATAVAGGAGRLGMVTQPPAAAVNGAALTTAPVVQLQDVNGNPVTTAGIAITAAIGSGPGGAVLGGLTTVGTDANGRATFTGLSITGLAGAYTLQFTSPGVTGVTSAAVTVSAGAATRLTITTEPPATAQSGLVIAPAMIVQVQDVSGNLVSSSTATVTAAIASGGGSLTGTVSSAAVAGVATFSNLILTGTTGARTLSFSSAGLSPDVSTAITLTAGNAASVAFVQEPTSVVAGAVVAPAVTVRVLDGAGNLVTTPAQTVALTISTNPGGATLGGTASVATVSGLATFGTLTLNRAGTGYRLRAAAGALVPDTSVTFNVTAGAAATIAANSATSQSDTAGLPVAAPPSVLVTDANSNPVAGVAVTFAVTGGGGSILPTTPVNTNASGVATLGSWTLGGTAGANTVTASVTGLAGSPVTFTATGVAGAATQLAIHTQPSAAAQSGVAFATQPVVRVADVFGNTVTTSSAVVTAALATGAGTLGGTLTATAAAGVATFTNLAITGPTGAYTVRFTSGALTPDTTTAVTLGAGTATRLAVAQQPSATAQNAIAFPQQPTVQLQDAAGNPVAQAGTVVTAAIATGGGTLGGTLTATTNAAGLATFTNLAITGTIGARTLTFSSGALTPATSAGITLTAGTATQIAINAGSSGLSATVGTAVATPPSAVVRDVSGNVVAGVAVTFAVASGGGAVLPVSAVVTNASGVAAATSWTLGTTAGANTATATATGLTGSPLTFTATGTAGAATQLLIQTQPSAAAQSGVAFVAQPVVRVADAFGNTVTSSVASVTAALATGTGTLGGTLSATAASGVATFTNLSITGVAGSYTLQFTSAGLVPDTSTAVTLGAGAATRLAVAQQPSVSAQNAIAFAQQPTVQLQDAAGNPVAQAGTVVTAAIATGGGTLGGTLTATTNAAGLATFTNLAITGTIGARTLSFSATGLTAATSGAVTITAGTATQIAINAGNAQSATVNTAVATAPSVIVRDVSGNAVAGVSVSFAVSGGGGSILPVTPVTTNASGIAALTSWTLGTTAGANGLQATSAGLTGSPVAFTATGTAGAATQLQVATQPATAAQSGVALAPQPAVRLADAFGNAVATTGTVVTAAIASGGGALGGTLTATTASGVATFTNLAISGTAGTYTLGFSATGLAGVTSVGIALGAGAASRLAMVVQPSASVQNAIAFPQQPQVQVQDAAGNPVAGVVSVTAAILTGGGTLGGTATVSTSAGGLATFAGLSITGTTGVRTLTFTSGALTAATSTGITVGAGLPTQMALQAGNAQSATAGSAVAIAPAVIVRDVSNNPVPSVAVTFAVASGGGSVLPTTPVATDALGIATATSWNLGTVAGANSLTATAAPGGITGNPFTFTATGVAGAAGRLSMFTQPPSGAQSGVAISPAPVVQLLDVNGNPVATQNVGITASIASGPGGVLSGGTVALTDASGRATFGSLVITGPTGSYTLQFNGPSLTGVNSSAITLSAGGAARVIVTAQPSSAQSGLTFPSAPAVQVVDAAGNPVSGAGRNIVVSLLAGGGSLTGTLTQATNASGVATFPGLIITGTIGPRTLLFSSAGIASDTTAAITLTPGTPSAIEFVQQPSTVTAGQVMAPSPTIRIRDASGNTVTTATNTVTMAIGTNPGGSTLGGTTSVAAVAGIATFSTLTLNRSGTGYTLTGSSGGLGSATSSAFTVNAGTATALAITTAPSAGQSGVTLSPQPVVRLVDVNGNTVPTSGTVVTAGLASGAGTLGGTLTATTVNGVATFTNLAITGTTGAYTINFSAPSVTSVTTGAITLSAGVAAGLAFQVQPSNVASGVAIAPAVVVRVVDGAGNLVPTATNSVSLAIGTNPGGSTLGGTTSVAAVAGVATFGTLTLDRVGTGYTLAAAATGLGGATSSAFNVTPGTATRLAFLVQPGTATAGSAIAPAVQVEVLDAAGNRVTGSADPVTLAIGTNPGGSTLTGGGPVAAVSGVATFSGLVLNRTGAGYTLAATSGSLAGATSTAFTVNPGAATAVAITSAPSAAQSGVVIPTALVVRLVDASGNTVPTTGTTVTASLASGAGALGGTVSAGTVSGVATFTALVLTGTVGNYTINLAATGLTSVTTGAIALSAGAPAGVAFQVQPSGVVAGATMSPAVTVRVLDGAGNLVTTATNQVTLGIGNNPGGAALTGGGPVSAVGGVATFGGLSLDRTGTGYTLAATSAGLTGATSSGFTVTSGVANRVAFLVQPTTATAGAALNPAVQVEIRDALGNRVTSATDLVTLAIGTNPGGSTLGGTVSVAAVAGVAMFSNVSLNRTGTGYTLTAGSGALTGATSSAFDITPGVAAALAITTMPTTAQSGVNFSTLPVVRVVDANGNTVPTNGTVITAGLASGPGSLGGILTASTTNGVATFGTLALTGTTGSYTLNFSSGALTPVTSGTVTLSAGAPAALAFLVQPPSGTAGSALTPAVQVRVVDGAGNTVPTATNAVTLAIVANPGGSTLGGGGPVAAVAGVATFGAVTLDRTGAGYTLSASAAGLTPVTSGAFTINPGLPAALVLSTSPNTGQSGIALSPQPAVRVVDALGNTVATSGTTITAALASGSGTLGGTLTANTVSGTATFTNLALTGTVGNYTITFTAGGVSGVTSGPIALSAGAPAALAYAVQPSTVIAGAAISPAVQVRVMDGAGNTVTTATNTVALAIGTNPGGATLGGTTSTAAVAGVATFSNLSLNRSGTGYTLAATSGGLTGATSGAFNVDPGAASALAITTAPTTGQSGAVLSPQPVVRLVDALGNTVPTSGTIVTAAIASGSGTLGGTLTAATVNGVATFTNLAITGTVGNYTLNFSAPSVTSVTTGTIALSAGAPAALAFTQQPSTSVAGTNITPTMSVRIVDGAGNTVSSATNAITLGIGTNPGGGILSGTTTQSASGGSANFPGMSINRSGVGYTLLASATGLTSATSSAFDITPAAASAVAFLVQPSTVTAGASIAPAVQVEVRDPFGNRVTSSTATVAIALGANPGGSTLGGTTSVAAVAGVATFSTLSLNRSAAGYTLSATSGGLTAATSAAFAVDPGAATALAITTMPTTAVNGAALAPQPVIRLVDANGNTVPSNGVVVTAALASGSGVLGGTLTASTSNGVATFANLALTGTVGNYTINFSSGVLTSVTSGAIALSAGAPAGLAFLVQPGTVASAAPITPAVQVRVIDASGNPVTTATNTVTMALGSNPVGGVLTGTLSVAAVGGVATFPNLTLDRAGVGYSLAASSTGLGGATSNAFNVTAGAASRLAFLVQPTTAVAAAGISPAVQVEVQDAAGNRVTSATTSITLTIGTNPGASTLSGTSTVSAVSGVATFPGISLNRTGTGYTLVANGGGLTAATSTAFDITPGAAAALAFSVQPGNVVAGVAIAPAVVVEVRDASGNRVTTATTPITLGFGTNAGGATLGGAGPVSAVAGVATFGAVTLNRTGTAYTLTASGGALPVATSAAFNVTPAAPAALVFSGQPTGTSVGTAIAPPVTVRIEDALGNLTASTATVALAFGNNPAGATLGGTTSVAAVAGVATFNNLTVNRSGAAYTLVATSAGLTQDTSTGFTITSATTSTTIVSDSPDPSVTGQPVTVNYSVISGGGTPTGNVTVSDGTVSCIGTVAAGNCALTFLTVGAKTITATYGGDANFATSASVGAAHTVNQAATTTVFGVQNPNPSTRGQAVNVTWSVPVTAPGTGTPTGNVTVSDGVDSCTAAVAAVSCNVTLTTVGARQLTITYAGDANYLGSASGPVAHTVNPAATVTTITSDLPDPSTVGQSVTVNYTVTGPAGTPTGTVTVSDGVGTFCTGTAAAGTCSGSFTTAGAKSLTATYAGDGNYTGSVSAGVGHTVNPASTTSTITANTPNPSVVGQSVAVNYTVTSGAGTPTGNVTVSDGVNSCVGTVAAGTCSLALTTAGARTLTATYATDGNFAGSASTGTAQTVNQASTTTTITGNTPNPSDAVTAVAVTWSVAAVAPGAGTPTGTVTVSDGVDSCNAPVAAGGCSLTLTTIGTRTLVATYTGDAAFAGSASTGTSQTVQ